MRKEQKWYDLGDKSLASQGVLDGKYRLGCAVLAQAVKDLHSRRYPLRAALALLWLADEGYLWADGLGFYIPEGELLDKAAAGRV